MESNECELLREISGKLDKLVGLFAAQGKSEDQQIVILRQMGFDWNFIGSVAGIKPKTAQKRFERH